MAGRGTDIVLGGSIEKQILTLREDDGARSAADKEREIDAAAAPSGRRGTTQVHRGRRPAHHRHRAPRIAPHRQPAARPRRPPGRPGLVALLPVARRSAAAHLRRRPPGARSWSGSRCPKASRSSIRIVTRSIAKAQRKVEARNFDIRKQLLEYDDVANDQRKVIYQQRNELLEQRGHRRDHPAT